MWLNSHLHNCQKVEMLVRTVLVRKWYMYKPSVCGIYILGHANPLRNYHQESAPKPIPTIKWCDMSSTINVSKKWKWTLVEDEPSNGSQDINYDIAGEVPTDTSVPNADANLDAPNSNGDNEDSDIDDDEATTKKADDAAHESVEGNAFDIEDIINVDNLDLCDTLSDKPISKPKPLLKEKQPTLVIAGAKELVESDWML